LPDAMLLDDVPQLDLQPGSFGYFKFK